MNNGVADEVWSSLLVALEAQLSGRASGNKECYEDWAREVARHLAELSPKLVMDSRLVLMAAATAFTDMARSESCMYLLTDALSHPKFFARTLVLMTGAPMAPAWQQVAVPPMVH